METSIEEILKSHPVTEIFDVPDEELGMSEGNAKAPQYGSVEELIQAAVASGKIEPEKKSVGEVFLDNIDRLNNITTEQDLDALVDELMPKVTATNPKTFRAKYGLIKGFTNKYLYAYNYAIAAKEREEKSKSGGF